MLKNTNLEQCKDLALAFLHMPIEETEFSPIVVIHPIFESALCVENIDGVFKAVNILESKNAYRRVFNRYFKRIEAAKDITSLYVIIRNSYRLAFLKHIKDYLSLKDFSELLADAWVSSENPNQDANVSVRTLASWFRQADKKELMEEEDYAVYDALPETLTVYRGVAVGRNPQGLSWTANRSTAEWFAHRFDNEDNKGYIQVSSINKSHVLAYFNTRGEDEIVVDSKGLKIRIE